MIQEITIATNSDIPELIDLLTDLFTTDIEFKPNYNKQKTGLTQIINDANSGEILVLKIDNKIIGMVSLLYSISTALGGKVAIVEDMIIHTAYRNQGLGKFLLHHAIEYSKKNDCLRLTLLTDYDNEGAINFYKKFGFTKSSMIPMRLLFDK